MGVEYYLEHLTERYPVLSPIREDIRHAYMVLEECYRQGNKLLVAGNGGSACDAQHIVAELMKGFRCKRGVHESQKILLTQIDSVRGQKLADRLQQALPAVALSAHGGLCTAFANDVDADLCYAQQVNGYGREGDVLLAISTSGNSENIIYAAITAKAMGMKVVGFTGEAGGALAGFSDICVRIPCTETYLVQELQLPVYHFWCMMLEQAFFIREAHFCSGIKD